MTLAAPALIPSEALSALSEAALLTDSVALFSFSMIFSGALTPLMAINSVSKTVGGWLVDFYIGGEGGWGREVVLKVLPAGMGPISLSPYPNSGGMVRVLFSPMHMSIRLSSQL